MPVISCPLCFGPTEVHVHGGACEAGHAFDEAELVRGLQDKADLALWAAIRTLEDLAAFGRLRRDAGQPVSVNAELAEEHVEALRDFIRGRACAG